MEEEEASLLDLDEPLLVSVIASLPLEDLLRLQRVCQRLRSLVADAGPVWRALYTRTWPPAAEGQQQQRQHQQHQQQQQQAQAPHQSPADRQGQLAAAGPPAGRSGGGRPPDPAAALNDLPAPGRDRSKRRREERGAAGDPAASEDAAAVDWRARFKARFVEQSRQLRLKRQARRLKAESALQVLEQEAHRLEAALAQEQQELPALQAQLAAVQRARQQAATHALAQLYWQPVAVQQAHGAGVVAQQEPQDAAAREEDLRQRVAVAQLEVRKLRAALEAKRRRAAEAQRKLQALLP